MIDILTAVTVVVMAVAAFFLGDAVNRSLGIGLGLLVVAAGLVIVVLAAIDGRPLPWRDHS